jgi:hypothetical protein
VFADAYWRKGMFDEALAEIKAEYASMNDEEVLSALDRGHTEAGFKGAMRAAADLLSARSATTYVAPCQVAYLYHWSGDVASAFTWLEKAYEVHSPNLPYLDSLWFSEDLRTDPRFQDLLRRMNFPE